MNPDLKETKNEKDQYIAPVDFAKNLRSTSVPTRMKKAKMEKQSSEIIDFKEMYVQWLFEYYQINMIDKSQQDKAAVTKAKELLNSIRQDVPTN